jgi:non-lysosomal glucosylceramidase
MRPIDTASARPFPPMPYVPTDKNLDPSWVTSLDARGERKVYRDAELETIGMPCGGIGAGQLYVRGDGTLAQWWVDNTSYDTGYGHPGITTIPMGTYPNGYNSTPHRPPSPVDQGFAVSIGNPGGRAAVRRLSRDGFSPECSLDLGGIDLLPFLRSPRSR